MVALTVVLGVAVVLLGVLVVGLLRSHAHIMEALHDLGVGIGGSAEDPDHERLDAPDGQPDMVPSVTGPRLHAGGDSTSVPTVAGVTPEGDALAVAPAGSRGLTVLAFLSTDSSSCARFWESFRDQDRLGLPHGTRLVVVTEGPDREIPEQVAGLASQGLSVVMSGDAWTDYEVPGSPFFVVVDGTSGCRIGEGTADSLAHLAELVGRAETDAAARATVTVDVDSDDSVRPSATGLTLVGAGALYADPGRRTAALDDPRGSTDADVSESDVNVRKAS
ncbi:MAG: hypothetical protein ABSB09_02285 [Acidimicrobiales bacterium]